ncbi:MAG: YlxR family protein, partial [Ilumatobacteraceae bacterium]
MPAPLRTCVGCRRRRPQAELVRCAVTPDGRAVVDRRAVGRGAWLCPPPGPCFELAMRRRGFER